MPWGQSFWLWEELRWWVCVCIGDGWIWAIPMPLRRCHLGRASRQHQEQELGTCPVQHLRVWVCASSECCQTASFRGWLVDSKTAFWLVSIIETERSEMGRALMLVICRTCSISLDSRHFILSCIYSQLLQQARWLGDFACTAVLGFFPPEKSQDSALHFPSWKADASKPQFVALVIFCAWQFLNVPSQHCPGVRSGELCWVWFRHADLWRCFPSSRWKEGFFVSWKDVTRAENFKGCHQGE